MTETPSQVANSAPVTRRPDTACPHPGTRSERRNAPIRPTRCVASAATITAPVGTTGGGGRAVSGCCAPRRTPPEPATTPPTSPPRPPPPRSPTPPPHPPPHPP